MNHEPLAYSVDTIIWFRVRVPVLSVLIALVAPRVSTSVRFLTTALASASWVDPIESRPETKAGMPVGMAEMAMAVPSSSSWSAGIPRSSPTTTMTATAPHAMMPSTLVSESSSRCSGDRVRVTEVSIVAICPICVSMPVAVTTMVAVPRVTEVFWKSMLVRSPSPTSAEASGPASLAIGALSPVSAASCASRVADRTMRPSAGTMSPASSCTMSPGTTSVAGTSVTAPSRTTRACGTCILDRASTLARAVSSCRVPRPMLSTTSSPTRTPVETSPMSRLTTTTATSIRFIGSRSCTAAIAHGEGCFSAVIAFGPWDARRAAASVALRPVPASDPAASSTSCAVRAKGGGVEVDVVRLSLTGSPPCAGDHPPASGAVAPRR